MKERQKKGIEEEENQTEAEDNRREEKERDEGREGSQGIIFDSGFITQVK